MKKITIFTMQLKTPGGIERFVSTIANMFSKDYLVEVVANYGKTEEDLAFPLSKNVKITFLTPAQPKEISMRKLLTDFKWQQIPTELKRRQRINKTRNQVFKNFLQKLTTDYIITDRALYNLLITKYYRGSAKKIATDHNFHQNQKRYINELMKSIKGFDYFVVATDELRDFYNNKTDVKCVKINNPLNEIPTKKSTLSSKNLISVGRFVPEKNFEALIDVMKIVHKKDPNIHLTIIGDGVTRSSIESKIQSLRLEKVISLPGPLKQNEIAKYYYDSSIFVMTSRTEAFGLVLAEAMSYGLPCIAFSCASGARAQITPENGILIKNKDISKMAEKILYVLNNRKSLKSLQENIDKEINEKYSKEVINKQWKKLLN